MPTGGTVKLLIARGDSALHRNLEFILQKEGYQVSLATDGHAAVAWLQKTEGPVIAVLDVEMPEMTGVEICWRVLAECCGQVARGLEVCANDYVIRPCGAGELQARACAGAGMPESQHKPAGCVQESEGNLTRVELLRELLRRDTRVYEFGPFRLEATERRLLREGIRVRLTSRVFDLLLLLVQNRGHLIEKQEIMRAVWADCIVEDNNLTVNMSALRRALGGAGDRHGYIETVSKRGYRFRAAVEEIKSNKDLGGDP